MSGIVEAARVYKVLATRRGYGWTDGAFVLIEVPEADVVTTIDIQDGVGVEALSVEVMDAARSAIINSAEERGGLGADGAFAIDLEWAD